MIRFCFPSARGLATAAALISLAATSAAASPAEVNVETLFWTRTALTDVAFERDLVAWVGEPSGDCCVRLFSRSTVSVVTESLAPREDAIYGPAWGAGNVTVTGRRLLWVSSFGAHTAHERVDTTVVGEPTHRILEDHELDYSGGGWVDDTASGDGTFAFSTAYDERTCTADEQCESVGPVKGSISVFRNGRLSRFRLKARASLVATAGDRVATVQPDVATDEIVLHSLSGRVVRTIPAEGTVYGVALSTRWVAAVTGDRRTRGFQLFDRRTGSTAMSISLANSSSEFQVAVSGTHAVVASGRRLWTVDIARRKLSPAINRPYLPRGVSIEGRRIAWGERVGTRGRVLAVTLDP